MVFPEIQLIAMASKWPDKCPVSLFSDYLSIMKDNLASDDGCYNSPGNHHTFIGRPSGICMHILRTPPLYLAQEYAPKYHFCQSNNHLNSRNHHMFFV